MILFIIGGAGFAKQWKYFQLNYERQLVKMFYDKEKMDKNIEKNNDKNTINRMVEHGGREILSKGAMSTTPHTSEVKIMLSTIIPLKDLIAN